ncbi:hypothetical protein I4U23_021675 [Adineta vaga]|nr:hypothetical protein I4U23_021675 [Adineta vaga]
MFSYKTTYLSIGHHGSYEGNGYVYEFRGRLFDLQSNLSELHRLGWIDNPIRVLIIQFTLYNPTVRFEPLNFYSVFTSLFELICLRKLNEDQTERKTQMRTKYYGPVEQFSDKVDQLLDALNRLYQTQTNEEISNQ